MTEKRGPSGFMILLRLFFAVAGACLLVGFAWILWETGDENRWVRMKIMAYVMGITGMGWLICLPWKGFLFTGQAGACVVLGLVGVWAQHFVALEYLENSTGLFNAFFWCCMHLIVAGVSALLATRPFAELEDTMQLALGTGVAFVGLAVAFITFQAAY